MLTSNPRPAMAGASWLLAAALAMSSGAQELPEPPAAVDDGCVLPAILLAEDGADTLIEIATEGTPRSLGARIEEGYGVVLDLAGCVPGQELSGLGFAEGLVSGVHLVQRSDDAGPVTAVAVETREPVEYTVTSSTRAVRVRLQPRPPEAMPAAESPGVPVATPATASEAEPAAATAAPLRRVQVLEPLPPAPADPDTSDAPAAADPTDLAGLTESWARAWSDQRVEDYLSFYAAAFRPAAGSRAAWVAGRRERLAAPGFIEIGLDGLQLRREGEGRAAVSFWQSYTSDVFSDLVYKTLTWIREDGRWKILREDVGPAPEPATEVTGGPSPPRDPSPAETAPSAAPPEALAATVSKLLEGARLSILRAPAWDPTYRILAYPGGDPGWQRGSATDLVVRAYRHLGIDLQQRIHQDILAAGSAYGITTPDPNIDHRRIRNLLVFLRRHGEELELGDWRAGDLVFWSIKGRKIDHVGVVSDRVGPSGLPMVIHHRRENPAAEEDVLDVWPIRAHFRWLPPGT